MDRRLTPANSRVALQSLRGVVDAPRYVAGEAAAVIASVVDLRDGPSGNRDRQLLWGEAVTVIERNDGWAFVQAAKDGYCGYVDGAALGAATTATHRVATAASHLYSAPRVQASESAALSFGSLVTVTGNEGTFAKTPQGFIPAVHLRPLDAPFPDPVGVAELFLGTPYLWGGNSRAGIDCSGLVQAALIACGQPCPADSDQQRTVGTELPEDAALQRGDLVFWKGHVAMAVDADRLIHANGHTMSVAYEGVAACIARVMAQEGLPVLMRRRPL